VPIKRVELAWLKVERSDGRLFSASPTDRSPRDSSWSADSDVIGDADSSAGRAIRLPVTTTVSPILTSSAGVPLLLV